MSLREVLTFEVVREGNPVTLAGTESLDRPVRWVHSSEIYEIAPLLRGGELLLTTGLGLVGMDAAARRRYVRDLATGGVAGIAMEVGRSFEVMPPEMVDEARRQRFPLIVFTSVVPFVRVTEVINTALVDYTSHGSRAREFISRGLNEALLAGTDSRGLLCTAAALLQMPLIVMNATGVAFDSVGGGELARNSVLDAPTATVPVVVHGSEWGQLIAGTAGTLDPDHLYRALEYISNALAFTLLRTGSPSSHREEHARSLLHDLVATTGPGEADVNARAELAGFRLPPRHRIVGVAIQADRAGSKDLLVDGLSQLMTAPSLSGVVEHSILVIQTVPEVHADPVGAVERALNEVRQRSEIGSMSAAVGPAVSAAAGFRAIGRSLRDAHATLRFLTAPGDPTSRITSARAYVTELNLTRTLSRSELGQLAENSLGPVIDWDRHHESELVHTLEQYLRNGCSATKTAARLFLHRQSLYQRVDRIELLLGFSVSDPDLHTTLLVAAVAYRLRDRVVHSSDV